MPTLTINGTAVTVPGGTSVLAAAAQLGIEIPTLCWLPGCTPETSCMVCLVKELHSGRLIPACTALAGDGMQIATDTAEVHAARRTALELLLSEHLGDCEAPCQRICPAHLNIPRMLRQIAAGHFADALRTIREEIPLPGILGRICPAPCEKGCRRGVHDQPVAICLLKRFPADCDAAADVHSLPEPAPPTQKRVAIVGAGPAGLTSAYYLRLAGHACTLWDDQALAGGALRHAVPEARLPRAVLDAEIDVLRRLGVEFRCGVRIGRDLSLAALREQVDAVVLAVGVSADGLREALALPPNTDVTFHPHTLATAMPGVFAALPVRLTHMAVQAVALGKHAAWSVDQYLRGEPAQPLPHRFNSTLGRLREHEIQLFLADSAPAPRRPPQGDSDAGYTPAEAIAEAARCLHCDCRKPEACRLRQHAQTCGAHQPHQPPERRAATEIIRQHANVVFEPGKCIKCGICVQISEREKEPLGLTFVGRGFDVRVAVPFSAGLGAGLTHTARRCVEACPTAALAWRADTAAAGVGENAL